MSEIRKRRSKRRNSRKRSKSRSRRRSRSRREWGWMTRGLTNEEYEKIYYRFPDSTKTMNMFTGTGPEDRRMATLGLEKLFIRFVETGKQPKKKDFIKAVMDLRSVPGTYKGALERLWRVYASKLWPLYIEVAKKTGYFDGYFQDVSFKWNKQNDAVRDAHYAFERLYVFLRDQVEHDENRIIQKSKSKSKFSKSSFGGSKTAKSDDQFSKKIRNKNFCCKKFGTFGKKDAKKFSVDRNKIYRSLNCAKFDARYQAKKKLTKSEKEAINVCRKITQRAALYYKRCRILKTSDVGYCS